MPFTVLGLNSITVYMLSHKVIDYTFSAKFLFGGLGVFLSTELSELVLSIACAVLIWLSMYFLYRNKLFLKV